MLKRLVPEVLLTLLLTTTLASTVYIRPTNATTFTTVRIVPEIIEIGPLNVIGYEFKVAVVVENVSNLYGLEIQLAWNTTYLAYINHTITIPIETYPAPITPSPYPGILHQSTFIVRNEVNTTAGIYWLGASSLYPAPAFTGNGTVFTMAFRVITQPTPAQGDVSLSLGYPKSLKLGDPDAQVITHEALPGTVIIHAFPSLYDTAIISIATTKDGCQPMPTISRSFDLPITVTVQNQGLQTTLDVTLFANTTAVQTQTIADFTLGNQTTLVFMWNTTSVALGNYYLTAYALPHPEEADTEDNIRTTGPVKVTIVGNVNGDSGVDIFDLINVANAYGSLIGQPVYNPNADINGDGIVDIFDLIHIANHYGETNP